MAQDSGAAPVPRMPFGRRGEATRQDQPASVPAFGRRIRLPISHVSLQKERLRGFYAELWMLFSDPAVRRNNTPITFNEAEEPVIFIGIDATIHIDFGGAFVFQRTEEGRPVYTVTTSDVDRLMDFVIAHLARTVDTAQGDLAHVERTVGKSIRDVERLLILSTLRHCQGNRRKTAGMLGISLPALRSKLHSYWTDLASEARRAIFHKPAKDDPSAAVELTFLDC